MGLFDWIGGIFKPASELIDNIHTSEEEKLELKNTLEGIREKTYSKVLSIEMAMIEARKEISVAESNSQHVITAIWRPIASCSLVILVCIGTLGYANLTSEFYDFAKAFLGIYIGGRSLEKAAKIVKS